MKQILAGLFCVASTLLAQVEYEYPIDSGGVVGDAVSSTEVGTTVFTFTVEESQAVSRIRLRFAASHEFVADIEVILKAPDGTEVRLFDGIGWDGGLFMNTYFDDVLFTDSASDDIGRPQQGNDPGTDIGPWSGSYRCEEQGESEEYQLSSFIGVNSKGTWQLIINDYETGDTGYIYGKDEDSDKVPTERSRFGKSLGTALFVQFASPPELTPFAQWRVTYFGTPSKIGDGASGVDFEGDGLINLVEYGLGRNPLTGTPTSALSFMPTCRRDIAQNKFILSMDLPSPASDGVLYRVQASSNLKDWDVVASKSGTDAWVVTEGVISESANGEGRKIVELAVDISGQSKRWLRLQMVEEP